jgi:hypothetical protein
MVDRQNDNRNFQYIIKNHISYTDSFVSQESESTQSR